jgi:hypothetical protein
VDGSSKDIIEVKLPVVTSEEPKKGNKEGCMSPLDLARVATYFHTADKVAYADISIEGNRHTYAVRSKGLKDGEFMAIFNESREQSRQVVIESSPVGEAIIRLMENYPTPTVWKNTASELLNVLEKYTDEATYRSRFFPKAAHSLTRQLNRLSPDLRAMGIDIGYLREGKECTRLICIQKVVKI